MQHLRDEQEFIAAARSSRKHCELRDVSFIKPVGAENEHPGYASEPNGSNHLVDLLKAIEGGRCRKDTMVIVTYDEFGGQWDHIPPPGQGGSSGPHDAWGPGTRIPALTIAPGAPGQSSSWTTRSTTRRRSWPRSSTVRLPPVSSRDAAVRDMSTVFQAARSALGRAVRTVEGALAAELPVTLPFCIAPIGAPMNGISLPA